VITTEDREFLTSFEQCSLGSKCWTHAAHLRMGWLVLQEEKSFDSALTRIRQGIQRFNTSNNSIGYHETITVAFARIINERRQAGESWEMFAEKNKDLFEKSFLGNYYSKDVLASEQARASFVEPDIGPLSKTCGNTTHPVGKPPIV